MLINNVFLSFGEGSFFNFHGHSPGCSTIETLNGFKAIGGNVYTRHPRDYVANGAGFFISSALAERAQS